MPQQQMVYMAPQMMGVPQQQMMGQVQAHGLGGILAPKLAMLVKQTPKGCVQEFLGCEAESEFNISSFDWGYLNGSQVLPSGRSLPSEIYALENSSCLCRQCLKSNRSLTLDISEGATKGGPLLMQFRKPVSCHGGSCFWCLWPKMKGHLPGGKEVNESRYHCDCCCHIPKFMYSENGKDLFKVMPPTCCAGMCIQPNCKGGRCLAMPFFFYDPETGEQIKGTGPPGNEPQILKVWGGVMKECCTQIDTFAVFFPPGVSAETKAGLLGMTFFIDYQIFEGKKEENGGTSMMSE